MSGPVRSRILRLTRSSGTHLHITPNARWHRQRVMHVCAHGGTRHTHYLRKHGLRQHVSNCILRLVYFRRTLKATYNIKRISISAVIAVPSCLATSNAASTLASLQCSAFTKQHHITSHTPNTLTNDVWFAQGNVWSARSIPPSPCITYIVRLVSALISVLLRASV